MLQPGGKHARIGSDPSSEERPKRMDPSATHADIRKPESTEVLEVSSAKTYRIISGFRAASLDVGSEGALAKLRC